MTKLDWTAVAGTVAPERGGVLLEDLTRVEAEAMLATRARGALLTAVLVDGIPAEWGSLPREPLPIALS